MRVNLGIITDLRRRIQGDVCDADELIERYSHDYGNVVHRRPGAVVLPRDAADVARTVRYAFEHGLPVSARAMGHSLRAQSLSDGGIVIDMRGLRDIEPISPEDRHFTAGAGALWREVVAAAAPWSLSPPVLTSYPHVSVGGTHAAGGWGMTTRYGTQVDNCLSLEVVTGEGELLRCSREENAELFHHVLGGLGQFGIMTRVRHRLRQHRPRVRTYTLHYDDLAPFLEDSRTLMLEDVGDYLERSLCQTPDGPRAVRWHFEARVTVEAESREAPDDARVLSEVRPARVQIEDGNTAEFISLPMSHEKHAIPGIANPWMVTCLPWSRLKEYIETCCERIPPLALGGKNGPMRLWVLRRSAISMPMLRTPEEDVIALFSICPTAPESKLETYKALMSKASDLSLSMGGKRHLTTWVHFDLPRWRLQFGDYWPKVNEMKRRYDPAGILNPGFIEYEPPDTRAP